MVFLLLLSIKATMFGVLSVSSMVQVLLLLLGMALSGDRISRIPDLDQAER